MASLHWGPSLQYRSPWKTNPFQPTQKVYQEPGLLLLPHPEGRRGQGTICCETLNLGTVDGVMVWSHLNDSQFNVWQDENSGDSFHFPKIYLFFWDTFMVCFSIIISDVLLIRLQAPSKKGIKQSVSIRNAMNGQTIWRAFLWISWKYTCYRITIYVCNITNYRYQDNRR